MTETHQQDSRNSSPSQAPDTLPLLLVCRLGDKKVAIELRFVDEVFRTGYVTPIPRAPACFVGLTNLRGRVVVLLDPAPILSSAPPSRALPGRTAVLVSWRNIHAGLLVDHIEDVTKDRRYQFKPAAETSLTAGTIELDDGTVELVHIERLLREAVARSSAVGAELARQVAS